MKLIGITGGIACGKTTLCETLRALGAPVWDADATSRQATAPGGAALPAIRAAFGEGVFTPAGELNRKALGALVFNDEKARRQLDAIVHPLVYEDMARFVKAQAKAGACAVFLDVPLLYETGYDRFCDKVWCAYVPEETQLRRLMNRDRLTRAEALARIRSQMPLSEKTRRADAVIDTSGTIAQSAQAVARLYQTYAGSAFIPRQE